MVQIILLKIIVKSKYEELKKWLIKNVKYIDETSYIFDDVEKIISLENLEKDKKEVSLDFYSGFLIKRIFECVRGVDLELTAELNIDNSIINCQGTIHNKKMSYKVYDIENNSVIKIVL